MYGRLSGSRFNLCVLFISFLYASFLAGYIPVDDSIKDRINYLAYASDSDLILIRYISAGYIPFFTNEPLWLLTNIGLSQLFEPVVSLKIIIFFSAFFTAALVLKANPNYFLFLLLLLFFPQVIGKFVVHVRQGFAISIFLMGWFSLSKHWRWFLFLLTPFIHASFFFVILIYSVASVLKQLKFALGLRTTATVSLGLIIGLGLELFASILGARQAGEYAFRTAEVSGLGFLFWFGVMVLYWMQGRGFARDNVFAVAAITFYLTTYFLIEVAGRIFESMIIVVLLASLGLTSWRKKVFLSAITAYFGLAWFLEVNQPWLGWGAES